MDDIVLSDILQATCEARELARLLVSQKNDDKTRKNAHLRMSRVHGICWYLTSFATHAICILAMITNSGQTDECGSGKGFNFLTSILIMAVTLFDQLFKFGQNAEAHRKLAKAHGKILEVSELIETALAAPEDADRRLEFDQVKKAYDFCAVYRKYISEHNGQSIWPCLRRAEKPPYHPPTTP